MVTERQDFVVVNTELMRNIDAEALRSHLQGAIEDQEDLYAALTSILKQVGCKNAAIFLNKPPNKINKIILKIWVLTPM